MWSRGGDVAASQYLRIALALYDHRQRKTQEIQALERDIAGRLVQTPYVLLLSFPGINVLSAADFAGEMGPVAHYLNAKSISGRAGLRPSRYQSDAVDKANPSRISLGLGRASCCTTLPSRMKTKVGQSLT